MNAPALDRSARSRRPLEVVYIHPATERRAFIRALLTWLGYIALFLFTAAVIAVSVDWRWG